MTPDQSTIPSAPEVQPLEPEPVPAATANETVAASDTMSVSVPTIAELLEHRRQEALAEVLVSSDRCLHVRIANRDEQGAVAEKRAAFRAQAKAEGIPDDQMPYVLNTLAPLPPTAYELTTDDTRGDLVVVHAGHSVSARELARFGLTAEDIAAANAPDTVTEESTPAAQESAS